MLERMQTCCAARAHCPLTCRSVHRYDLRTMRRADLRHHQERGPRRRNRGRFVRVVVPGVAAILRRRARGRRGEVLRKRKARRNVR
eukprot:3936872-Rhodomonas_salina.8